MHPLRNGSQVTARPARKATAGTPGYFSESNDNDQPSYPGQDWFNDVIEEFANALAAANITYVPGDLTHLQKLLAKASSTFPVYDSATVYSYGDVVYKTIGGVKKFFQWYSNVESLAGKDPELAANRRTGWSDTTKPFYWLPYSPKLSGETIYWDSDSIPENMVVGMGQQLPIAVYHTLAAAKPEWIDGIDPSLINVPDRQGRFVRGANGVDWLAGETHEDAMRNITGKVSNESVGHALFWANLNTQVDGVFGFGATNGLAASTTTAGSRPSELNFDASRVVPTSDEIQPKAYIEWVGYAL